MVFVIKNIDFGMAQSLSCENFFNKKGVSIGSMFH